MVLSDYFLCFISMIEARTLMETKPFFVLKGQGAHIWMYHNS